VGLRRRWILNSLLITVASFSETAVWVFGALFVADLVLVMIYVYRIGNVDKAEGRIVTEHRPLSTSDWITMGGSGFIAGKYWGKHKVLVSRSTYITEMSLVDGTATKSQRLLVRGIQLAAFFFWLAWVFGALTLLPSIPALALVFLLFVTIWFLGGVRLVLKGRADALRQLKERRASRKDLHKA
jgi:hypothetical protein